MTALGSPQSTWGCSVLKGEGNQRKGGRPLTFTQRMADAPTADRGRKIIKEHETAINRLERELGLQPTVGRVSAKYSRGFSTLNAKDRKQMVERARRINPKKADQLQALIDYGIAMRPHWLLLLDAETKALKVRLGESEPSEGAAIQLSLFTDNNLKSELEEIDKTSSSPPKPETSPMKRRHERHEERLARLNLRFGSTFVYFLNGVLVGYGDVIHCPREDIEHNLVVLAEYLKLTGATAGGLGKAYDSDTYVYGNIEMSKLPMAECWLKMSDSVDRLERDRKRYEEPLYRLAETERGFEAQLMKESQ